MMDAEKTILRLLSTTEPEDMLSDDNLIKEL